MTYSPFDLLHFPHLPYFLLFLLSLLVLPTLHFLFFLFLLRFLFPSTSIGTYLYLTHSFTHLATSLCSTYLTFIKRNKQRPFKYPSQDTTADRTGHIHTHSLSLAHHGYERVVLCHYDDTQPPLRTRLRPPFKAPLTALQHAVHQHRKPARPLWCCIAPSLKLERLQNKQNQHLLARSFLDQHQLLYSFLASSPIGFLQDSGVCLQHQRF